MAELSTDARNRLKSSTFALPGRRFPIPDRAHAANAKARATQGLRAGTLSPAQAVTVRRKANAKLGRKNSTGVNADLNLPGNRSPQTPLQEDINNWKSKPVTERKKFMSNTQGTGRADDSGVGTNYKGQKKFGGTEAPSANKKSVPKTGGTQETGTNYKGQEKLGGTGMGNGNGGKRWSNGSDDHDTMRGMIKNH